MKTTDELYIAGYRVEFKEDPRIPCSTTEPKGSWFFKASCYEIEVFPMYDDYVKSSLKIKVTKDEKPIGSQTIPMESSSDRVLGIISKIISSYTQPIKELEEWAEKQSEEDYIF